MKESELFYTYEENEEPLPRKDYPEEMVSLTIFNFNVSLKKRVTKEKSFYKLTYGETKVFVINFYGLSLFIRLGKDVSNGEK